MSFAKECLSAAEEAAQEVFDCIHPTLDSEEERSDVIDHLRRLVKTHFDCDVFPYGSVPLKTYLPDGDIDLTVLRDPGAGESLPRDVHAVLCGEELNENFEYQITDTQFIDAEVKLVKCIVQNIVVDISFNQLGGLSTLCFLEQVDRLVGRNHLFKRSIILIKTWCFYESRILGATHGLFSTYALETLILYIFHLFHSTIRSPLVALHTFLDYYSQFDWDNYCISLKGPVCKSSLPNIEVKTPDGGFNDLLLHEEFMENCMGMFSVPFKGLEANQKAFQPKHLNIIDPLKENNNLGRSVNRGNFFRIRSAIKYGARKLGHVLSLPSDQVADGIKKFFTNALSRHRKHSRSKVEHLDLEFGDEASLTASSSSGAESSSIYDMLLESSSDDFDNDSVGVDTNSVSSFENEPDRCLAGEVSSDKASESCSSANGIIISGNTSTGDGDNLRTGVSYLSNRKLGASLYGNVKSPSKTESLAPKKFHRVDVVGSASHKGASVSEDVSENLQDDLDYLADLSGDYDSHLRSLLRGQLTIGFSSSTPVRHPLNHSVPLSQNHHFQVNPSAFSTGQTVYSAADHAVPAPVPYSEGSRGTGTYFPSVVSGFYGGRGRGKAPGNRSHFHRYRRGNGSYPASGRSDSFGEGSHGQRNSDAARCQSPFSVGDGNPTESYLNSSCRIEFGSVGNLAEEVISSASSQVRGGLTGNARSDCDK